MRRGLDWDGIDLVVFDVDGTLYDAPRLRRAMLLRLLAHAGASRQLETLRVLRTFRAVREALGDEEAADFQSLQYQRTARALRMDATRVRALTEEWMERRPLPLLRACRWPHVDRVFEGLRGAGKQVAVLSDYPAIDKLQALALRAHLVVSASDADVARLKPDPRGLRAILHRTGAAAARTLVIGDRVDRDAEVARRVGAQALVLSRTRLRAVPSFKHYDDPLFEPVLPGLPLQAAA